MPSPVRANAHAEPDSLLQFWMGCFAAHHLDLKVYANASLLLDSDNSVQPDGILCSKPSPGGRVWLDEKGYLHGSPELVCEIAASTASVDLHAKCRAYQRNGIAEYLVWLTAEQRLCWFQLQDEEYREQEPVDGVLSSWIFRL